MKVLSDARLNTIEAKSKKRKDVLHTQFKSLPATAVLKCHEACVSRYTSEYDMYALTHGLEYIMRYILRVILSNNGTRRSRVLLLDKMTRKIYLIMYERPCVNVFNARK